MFNTIKTIFISFCVCLLTCQLKSKVSTGVGNVAELARKGFTNSANLVEKGIEWIRDYIGE